MDFTPSLMDFTLLPYLGKPYFYPRGKKNFSTQNFLDHKKNFYPLLIYFKFFSLFFLG